MTTAGSRRQEKQLLSSTAPTYPVSATTKRALPFLFSTRSSQFCRAQSRQQGVAAQCPYPDGRELCRSMSSVDPAAHRAQQAKQHNQIFRVTDHPQWLLLATGAAGAQLLWQQVPICLSKATESLDPAPNDRNGAKRKHAWMGV